jgi:protein-S-isoprenylcysteine O-methyltransferase Ste14
MRDSIRTVAKAVVIGGTIIGVIVWGLFWLASMVTGLLGIPSDLGLPPALRLVGGAIAVAGLGLALWLLRYRNPLTMIVSTYFTFVKMFTRRPISRLEGRSEPLVVVGPQKYVRNSLYLGAVTMFLGWGILTDSTSSLVGVGFILLWFRLIQIPFEEKELRAIFGEQHERYSAEVPMLIPFRLKRRPRSAGL